MNIVALDQSVKAYPATSPNPLTRHCRCPLAGRPQHVVSDVLDLAQPPEPCPPTVRLNETASAHSKYQEVHPISTTHNRYRRPGPTTASRPKQRTALSRPAVTDLAGGTARV